MKLVKAHVTNFRSVEDSSEFDIDEVVTCLVGKNEAGKSALLTALAALNPHPATPFRLDKERDYPRRHLTAYAQRHPKGDATAVTTWWLLDEDDLADVEKEFGSSALKSNTVSVSRKYGAEKPTWSLDIDFQRAFSHLFGVFALDATERAPLNSSAHTDALKAALKKLGTPTPKHAALLKRLEELGSITARITAILEPKLPQFMYFSNYDRMDGAVQVEHLSQLISNATINNDANRGKRLFSEFLTYSGVPLQEILAVKTYETFNAKLQAASTAITDEIIEYWKQNPYLEVQVRIEQSKPDDPAPFNSGSIARARIYNQLHRVDTPFSERSAGFVWFFSFLVKFSQVKDESVPVILLLDEPGMSLHGKAQVDLLRFFDEKLAPYHQVIYSTHSPFMVAADRLLSARVVEDEVDRSAARPISKGTKVTSDVLSRDPDTLFPLQGALGYEVTQTLFVGKNTFLVEGPGDILFLTALSRALKERKRASLDARWTLCPAGGIGNVRSFVALFAGSKINVAVLADYAAGQKKEIERLRASQVLKTERVLTIQTYTGKNESDIEDLFAPEVYVDILNSAYDLTDGASLDAITLIAADESTERLVKKAEAYFRVNDVGAEFDHYKPAEWLLMNPTYLKATEPNIEATLTRAEILFKEMNSLL